MSTRNSDEIQKHRDLNNAFLGGEKILGIKFRHNSLVEFESSESGERLEGWIVAVGPVQPEPIYTVERCDGGDEEVIESKLTLSLTPTSQHWCRSPKATDIKA